jgi:hypothetical protein
MEGQDCCNRDEADPVQRFIPLRMPLVGRSMPVIRFRIVVLPGASRHRAGRDDRWRARRNRSADRWRARRNRNPLPLYDCHQRHQSGVGDTCCTAPAQPPSGQAPIVVRNSPQTDFGHLWTWPKHPARRQHGGNAGKALGWSGSPPTSQEHLQLSESLRTAADVDPFAAASSGS